MQERNVRTLERTVIRGGRVLNVFTGELIAADVVVEGSRIAELVPPNRAEGTRTIDASGRVVAPGYVEPHAHLGLLADPVPLLERMAAAGTTAVVADTYPFMAMLPDEELERALGSLGAQPVFVRWFAAPHARSFLPGEERLFSLERVERLLGRDDVVAIGEITRWPAVERGDPDLLAKIARAQDAGKRVEGHSAGASPARIMRLAARGFTSCHEAIAPEEVLDRLRAGLYAMLRHSSLRPDLPRLVEAVRGPLAHSNRIMLTADGPSPPWIAAYGYMDHLIRIALESGIPPEAAYRMATLNPAMYYGIEHEVGSVAPGRRADLVILRDLADPSPLLVMAGGVLVAREGRVIEPFPAVDWTTLSGLRRPPGRPPGPEQLAYSGPGPKIPELCLAHTVILRLGNGTGRPVRAALCDWEGRWMTRTWLSGFADVAGLASTYTAAGQLAVIGRSPADMALAARRVAELGGGMVLAESGKVLWELKLEWGGLFTQAPWDELVAKLAAFETLLKERGYGHTEPLYSIFFLGFDSLPDFRLTCRGVWDVKRQQVVAPPVRLV